MVHGMCGPIEQRYTLPPWGGGVGGLKGGWVGGSVPALEDPRPPRPPPPPPGSLSKSLFRTQSSSSQEEVAFHALRSCVVRCKGANDRADRGTLCIYTPLPPVVGSGKRS